MNSAVIWFPGASPEFVVGLIAFFVIVIVLYYIFDGRE